MIVVAVVIIVVKVQYVVYFVCAPFGAALSFDDAAVAGSDGAEMFAVHLRLPWQLQFAAAVVVAAAMADVAAVQYVVSKSDVLAAVSAMFAAAAVVVAVVTDVGALPSLFAEFAAPFVPHAELVALVLVSLVYRHLQKLSSLMPV